MDERKSFRLGMTEKEAPVVRRIIPSSHLHIASNSVKEVKRGGGV